jgi:hypothetical protein
MNEWLIKLTYIYSPFIIILCQINNQMQFIAFHLFVDKSSIILDYKIWSCI